jgi:hypothetical protein
VVVVTGALVEVVPGLLVVVGTVADVEVVVGLPVIPNHSMSLAPLTGMLWVTPLP